MFQKIRGVSFEKQKHCDRIIDHGVLGGTLKSMNIDKIHKIHVPNIQGVLFEKHMRLRQDHGPWCAWRDPKIDEH